MHQHTHKSLALSFCASTQEYFFYFDLFASHTETSKLKFSVARQTGVLKKFYTCSLSLLQFFISHFTLERGIACVCVLLIPSPLYRHNGICSMMHFCCLIFIITIITDFVMHVPRFSINSTTRQGELKVIGVLCCSKKMID